MSGGEALVKSLVREGVEVVFGIPGIQMYGIVAALRDEPGIRMVTTRHEQATTYMADGYARAVGETGGGARGPGSGPLQCGGRPDQRVLPLLARAPHCGPDPARRNRRGHRGRSRSRGPAGHGAVRDQVAANGVQAPRDSGCRVRSVPADADRPVPAPF